MNDHNISYEFKGKVWKYQGDAGWYFVSLPKEISKEIREYLGSLEEGWGRLKSKAKISETEWETAIWFDTKADTYILPLKAEIRKKEKICEGDVVKLEIGV